MKAKNKLITMLVLSAGAAAATSAINKFIQVSAVSKNILAESEPLCFKWRFGDIYYTKAGSGKPLLLIHDLNSAASGYEWNRLVPLLKENHTVYTIDLLGFGRSEKPNLTYTNYLYTQLITDFVKSVIGHRADIIASGEAASIPIMSCSNHSEFFDRLFLINPLSLHSYAQMPGKLTKYYKCFLDLPIIGTLIYNIANSRQAITDTMRSEYFSNPYSVKSSYVDAYYESAHLGGSPKSVYASIYCYYTRCNISNALKKIDNSIYLIGGNDCENINALFNEYKQYNPAIETSILLNCKHLPQLECPSELFEILNTFMN